MYTDPTEYHRQIEPTQAAYRNPYEATSPYDGEIPPPPKQHYRGLLVVLVSILCLSLGVGGVLFGVMHSSAQQQVGQITQTPAIPTSTRITPIVNQSYTASDILRDFNAAGIHPTFVEYDTTIWSWTADTYAVSANATSSVNFTDDSACTGPCSPANVGLWVYDNPATAMQAYHEVVNDEHQSNASIPMMGIPQPTLHGRCLLLSNSDQPIYVQVVMQDCV